MVATPGRLIDLILNSGVTLESVSMVILDEADQMLDMGFFDDITRIMNYIRPDCQVIMYSATWPRKIENFAQNFLKNHVKINIGNNENDLSLNPNIIQNFIFSRYFDKRNNFAI